jgi:hypothetical protein
MKWTCVTIYQKPTYLLLELAAKTVEGWTIGDLAEPVQKLAVPIEPAELGIALRALLYRSREGVPHPTNWKQLEQEWLKHVGMRSARALYKECKVCTVEHAEGHCYLWATKTDSVGTLNIGQPLVVSEDDAFAIGQGVLQMLEQSQR